MKTADIFIEGQGLPEREVGKHLICVLQMNVTCPPCSAVQTQRIFLCILTKLFQISLFERRQMSVCVRTEFCAPRPSTTESRLGCDAGAASVRGSFPASVRLWTRLEGVCYAQSSALRAAAELLQLETEVRTQLLPRMQKYPMFSLHDTS